MDHTTSHLLAPLGATAVCIYAAKVVVLIIVWIMSFVCFLAKVLVANTVSCDLHSQLENMCLIFFA